MILVVIAAVAALLLVDLLLFARGREPTFRESVAWSLGWFALSLAVAVPLALARGGSAAVDYTTVYLIERTLSLDNLFVFLLIFGSFRVPQASRAVMLFWGIVLALVVRGAAILVGVELVERFHVVMYALGLLLLFLAVQLVRGNDEEPDPRGNVVVRLVARVLPVSDEFHGSQFLHRADGRLQATPLLLALASVVAADIAFAVDSIPAAFAITTDSFVIWTANAAALLGLRALFTLVAQLIERFRFLDETLAVVLGIVAAKILLQDVVHIGPVVSLAVVIVCFGVGIGASLAADRRDARAGGPEPEPGT